MKLKGLLKPLFLWHCKGQGGNVLKNFYSTKLLTTTVYGGIMTDDNSKGAIIGDLTGVGQVIDSEVARRTYDEALSPTMRELGDIGADTLKAFRLFTAPIQLMSAYQDRFRIFCEKVRNKVPEDQQCEAPAEIARPVMEAFASTSDDSPLMSMFEELMAKAIDKREAGKLNPTFPIIIKNLSPLEAKLIEALNVREHTTDDFWKKRENMIMKSIGSNFDYADFGGLEHYMAISQNLKDKNLVLIANNVTVDMASIYPSLVTPKDLRFNRSMIQLSMFGRWFASACVGNKSRGVSIKVE